VCLGTRADPKIHPSGRFSILLTLTTASTGHASGGAIGEGPPAGSAAELRHLGVSLGLLDHIEGHFEPGAELSLGLQSMRSFTGLIPTSLASGSATAVPERNQASQLDAVRCSQRLDRKP
jgi:hypothetical protein